LLEKKFTSVHIHTYIPKQQALLHGSEMQLTCTYTKYTHTHIQTQPEEHFGVVLKCKHALDVHNAKEK
jgi:hypothetical protein